MVGRIGQGLGIGYDGDEGEFNISKIAEMKEIDEMSYRAMLVEEEKKEESQAFFLFFFGCLC